MGNMEKNKMLSPGEGALLNTHSEQIKEEFYKWFENRGLLAELRAYMRQLMVKALEENNSNGKTKWAKKSSTSPKLQAINLLVVDYLFHENYFYTVSVFASEAHILDSLPQYSRYVTESVQQRKWDPSLLPRFSRQETEDILDTLHLPPSTSQLRHTVDCYLGSQESLLACIVRTMVSATPHSRSYQEERMEEMVEERGVISSHQLWSEEMQQLLLMAGVKLSHIHRMQHKWAQIIEKEKQLVKKKAEEDFAAREAEWQHALEERLEEERIDLQERQSRVELREQSLATLADQLSTVHKDVTYRLSQLQLQNQQLNERRLQQEQEQLHLQQETREQELVVENIDCVPPIPSVSRFREQVPVQPSSRVAEAERSSLSIPSTKEAIVQTTEVEDIRVSASTQTLINAVTMSTQTVIEPVVAFTQTIDTEDHELQTSFDQQDPELLAQLEQARGKISELQEENVELRAHVLQQRHRIDELTNRAANLSSQLEESQIAMTVLRGRDSAVVTSALSTPTPPPVIIAPTFGYRTPQRQGGGEESLFAPRPQQAAPRVDGRRRPLRFSFSQQASPNSEESSPTDEVIQNARTRIEQLQQESILIRRNFQDFQNRLLISDSVMFPPLLPSRTSDSVMRVRRSEIRPNFSTDRSHPHFSLGSVQRQGQNHHQYNENQDSSSEIYDTVGAESISNSRRLFNQRNIRHFERWKQFKKKFQKREGYNNYSKRSQKALNSTTSSEDDDVVGGQGSRKQGGNQDKNDIGSINVNSKIQQSHDHHPRLGKQNIFDDGTAKKESASRDKEGPSNLTSKVRTHLDMAADNEVLTVSCPSKADNGIELDLERSAKLIESVKVLLDAQSIKESVATTMSNGSLAVESLPRDSVSNPQIDIGNIDGTVLTAQHSDSKNNDKQLIMSTNKNNTTDNIATSLPTQTSSSKQETHTAVFQETQANKNLQKIDIIKDLSLHDNKPENVLSTLPESNAEIEDVLALDIGISSSDLGDVESVERATTSLTSGSDILRELNPSKTDSSSSVISAGFGEDSKHSSDFWE
ncbi:uncharacterized protein LOC128987583 isoform X2 [Macrosteles quadrilineatus]|uniref:uncharacterized protein LOC128987583 isoform X2 n=1 Tax=Macrosteles quadrilineatus TaxID=74068 RepID=UPI0023E18245|nr:uncharacterized protein LOC128987583 isoform X2 [Macrosteles quadrilineatus]